jgi:hypothetical protein
MHRDSGVTPVRMFEDEVTTTLPYGFEAMATKNFDQLIGR